MIKKETVFIIGAGGSYPYGFPLGSDLRNYITSNFSREYQEFLKANKIHDTDIVTKIDNFTKNYLDSHTYIDLYLTRNPQDEEIGTTAISYKILKDESQSKFGEKMKFKNQDWYSYLFNEMTESILSSDEIEKLDDNKVTFVTFNYDRSLENFMYNTLIANFGQNDKETEKKIVNSLFNFGFYHVYGRVGKLPWQSNIEKETIDYRHGARRTAIQTASSNIQIMHNSRGSKDIEKIKEKIKSAKRVYFLGFAYAEENLNILEINKFIGEKEIYGTAYGLTEHEIDKIRSKIHDRKRPISPSKMIIEKEYTCIDLLRNCL